MKVTYDLRMGAVPNKVTVTITAGNGFMQMHLTCDELQDMASNLLSARQLLLKRKDVVN